MTRIGAWALTLSDLRCQLLQERYLDTAAAALVRALQHAEALIALPDALTLRMAELGKAKIRSCLGTDCGADDVLQSIWSGIFWLDEGLSSTGAEDPRAYVNSWLTLSEPVSVEMDGETMSLTQARVAQELLPWPWPMHLQSLSK
jgi:hypothetical protein